MRARHIFPLAQRAINVFSGQPVDSTMGFALLSPSYGTELVGWGERSEAHSAGRIVE
jgi:hypothetical protein